MYRIKVTVDSVRGQCSAGCKVGDVFYYEDGSIFLDDVAIKLCAYGISAIIPYLSAYCRSSDSNDWIISLKQIQCPDPINTVVYRLERMSETDS